MLNNGNGLKSGAGAGGRQYHVEVDAVNAAQWSELVDKFEDANLYQTWAYGEVRWQIGNLSHLVLKEDERPVAIAQVRLMKLAGSRFGIAYLRWGPLCQPKGSELREEVVHAMAVALKQEYAVKRGMSLQVLPNACAGTARARIFEAAFSGYRRENFPPGTTTRTLVLDLAKPLDQLRKNFDPKWRNKLSGAEKNNLTLVEGHSEELFQKFVALFHEMHSRKQFAAPAKIEDFALMQRKLAPSQKMKVFICEENGTPVAGAVIAAMGSGGIYLHGATSDNGLKAKGSYLLQWAAIQRLKQQGVRFYDLGGINPDKNPGVYTFKNGMSGQDMFYMAPLCVSGGLTGAIVQKAATFARNRFLPQFRRLLKRP